MENNYDNVSEESFLFGKDKKHSFTVPKDYFDSFSARLIKRMEFETELAEFKTLVTVKRDLKFAVPKNYFSSLTNILEYKYELSLYTELQKVSKPAPKPLSADYFSALDKKIMDQIELASELKTFTILSSLEKKNNFKLVPDYFEKSTDEVKDKIHAKHDHAPGVFEQLFNLLFKPRFAFAFGSLLLIGSLSVWYFTTVDSSTQTGKCQTVACLEKNELLNDNTVRDFNDENLIDMVDVDKLDKQMSSEGKSADSIKANEKK